MSEKSRRAWWKPWKWPLGVWVLLIGAFVLMLPLGIRNLILSGIPTMEEPIDVAEIVEREVPADEDASIEYLRAMFLRSQIVADYKSRSEKEPINVTDVYEQGWVTADEPLIQWLDLHREALAVWRRGTEKPSAAPGPAWDSIAEQQTFWRLAMLEETRCIHGGKFDDAWRWVRAAYRYGGHASRRGGGEWKLIQASVGDAIQAVSAAGIVRWAEQSGVTSEQLLNALTQLKSDENLYSTLSSILKAEYFTTLHLLQSPDWEQQVTIWNQFHDPNAPGMTPGRKFVFWVVGEPELSVRLHRQQLANVLPEIDKPAYERRKQLPGSPELLFDLDSSATRISGQLDAASIQQGINRSLLARQFLPKLRQFDASQFRRRARQSVIEVLLSIQAWRRDRGEFPQDLQQLVPTYLNAIPLDPCDPAGGPLRYRRETASKAVIWSVGYDGRDDGGDVEFQGQGRAPADVGYVSK